MAEQKIIVFVQRLYEATRVGKVTWAKTVKEGFFASAFPEYSVQVGRTGQQSNPIFLLFIFDSSGNVIEQVDVNSARDGSFYQMAKTFYEAVRSKAMGVDKAIDDILSAIDRK